MAIIDKKQKRWYSKSTFDSLDKTAIPVGTEIQVTGELGQSDFDADTNTKLNNIANKLDKTGGTISGSLTITQDLIVNGTTSTVETQNLKVADKLIYVAKDNTVALTTPAGLITPKYDGTNNGGIVYDSTGTAYVGDVVLNSDGNVDLSNSNVWPLCARDKSNNWVNGHVPVWDSTNEKLVDSGSVISTATAAGSIAKRNSDGTLFVGTTKSSGNGAAAINREYLEANASLLKGGTEIAENTDLNNLTTPGNYYCLLSATAEKLVNCPTNGNAFTMKVFYATGNSTFYLKQEIKRFDIPDYFIRQSTGSTWSSWSRYTTSDEVVLKTTDQSISGIKTFSDGIKSNKTPTADNDVVRKKELSEIDKIITDELNMKTSQEVFIGESLPTGTDARIWIDTGISMSELSKIYGVDKVGQENPTLTRTNDATGLTYAIGTSEITSDFDNCYPWSNMQEVTDSSGNVFIKIPKFYSKVTKNTDGTYKHQISGTQHEGFTTLFVDGKGNELDYILVGKYEGSGSASRVYSKSNATVLVNITRGNFRTACRANGAGYQQYDFLIDAIIKELFMIEFATTNSQSVMQGYTNTTNVAAIITGRTDAVLTPSGSPESNTDGKHACKYRGIENPFGNVWKWCDGINFDTEKIYVCEDPEYYADDKHDAPYTYMGNRLMSSGYLKEVTPFAKNPLLGYATAIGAGSTTHYSDYYYVNNAGTVLLCGGSWLYGASAGLWYWNGYNTASLALSSLGGRLCYKPL